MSEIKTIYQSMIGILTDVEAIGKNRKADMGNAGQYNFRGIDDMYNSLHELFVKHKVFIVPEVLDTTLEIQEKEKEWNGKISKSYQYSTLVKMKFTFVGEDGSSITATGIGHSLDTSDKGTNKAQSSALKYCLMQTFLIPTNDDKDVENQNNEVTAPKAQTQLPDVITTDFVNSLLKGIEQGQISKVYAIFKQIKEQKKQIDITDFQKLESSIKQAYKK